TESREEQPAAHPLFDYRLGGLHDRQLAIVGRHSTATHWIYDEHRTAAGQALLPGTGYLELARAALAELAEERPFEICDLFFLSPLAVDDDASQDVRVRLTPNELGYAFDVQSKRRCGDGRTGWQNHAQGRLELHDLAQPAKIDLRLIDSRCPQL